MNIKQKRDLLRASKGLGNNVDTKHQVSRLNRKAIFGGRLSFSQGLTRHFAGVCA